MRMHKVVRTPIFINGRQYQAFSLATKAVRMGKEALELIPLDYQPLMETIGRNRYLVPLPTALQLRIRLPWEGDWVIAKRPFYTELG